MQTFLQILNRIRTTGLLQPAYLPAFLLLGALVLAGFFLRISVFDSTGENFFHVDVARDFLIAGHMVSYGDLPLTGPDGYLGPNGNSPVYYYAIAIFLFLKNAVLFPGFVNLILQTATIPVVFFIGRGLFNKYTGYIAAAFFTFFDGVIAQAMHMWQPHLMHFFLAVSFLFLVYGFRKNRTSFLYAGTAMFAFSAVLHSSVAAIVPVYMGAVAYLLWRKEDGLKKSIKAVFLFTGILLVSYLPTLYYFIHVEPAERELSPYEISYAPSELPDPSVVQAGAQSLDRFVNLFTYFFEGSLQGPTFYTHICISMLLLGSAGYFLFCRDLRKRIHFGILWAGVGCAIISVGILKLGDGGFPIRYYTPIFIPFLLITAEVIVNFYSKNRILWVLKILAVLLVVFIASEYARSRFVEFFPARIMNEGIAAIFPEYRWPEDITALSFVIDEMSAKEGTPINFDIRTFENGLEHAFKNELVWVPLEIMLQRKLVQIDTATFRGYAVIEEPEHMFVRCLHTSVRLCESKFLERYSGAYSVQDVVYRSDTVSYIYARKN